MSFLNQKSCLIGPFSQIVTLADLPLKGALKNDQLQRVNSGGIVVIDGLISDVGNYAQLEKTYQGIEKEDVNQPAVLLPAMIDCHTHICYDGSRAMDYDLKLQGLSYLEIAKQGGGIWHTVQATRTASEEKLTDGLMIRAEHLWQQGIATVEVKSGYGLNGFQELKMLRAIKASAAQCRSTLVPTFLGAHTIPPDFDGCASDYLDELVRTVLPQIKKERLANRVDIFIEQTAFNIQDASKYLKAAKELGFEITVHADQFTKGGSKVAIQLGALSADHLEASGDLEILQLSQSNTIAVVLPGASLGLGMGFAPARKLLDSGCSLAIASDWNPGSAPMGDLLLQASLLGIFEKLSAAETFAGLTFRAAAALNLFDRGKIQRGLKAKLMAFPTADFREILYHQGSMKPFMVWG